LLNASGEAPENSWITITFVSTFPFVGIGICIIAGIIIPAYVMRKKKR
jgi:hypothetical protein